MKKLVSQPTTVKPAQSSEPKVIADEPMEEDDEG